MNDEIDWTLPAPALQKLVELHDVEYFEFSTTPRGRVRSAKLDNGVTESTVAAIFAPNGTTVFWVDTNEFRLKETVTYRALSEVAYDNARWAADSGGMGCVYSRRVVRITKRGEHEDWEVIEV